MMAGDADVDGQIDNKDKNDFSIPEIGQTGYLPGDYNMDGVVNSTDFLVWQASAGSSEQFPKLPGEYFTDPRDGEVYRTVQIGDQVWMAENMRYNRVYPYPASYCYANIPEYCDIAGRLYYNNGTGVCPSGWHYPTDDDWKILEGTVDSQYGVGDPEWDLWGEYRGFDAGQKLKNSGQWNGTDDFGFNIMPYGYRATGGDFLDMGFATAIWFSYSDYRFFTSTENGIYKGAKPGTSHPAYYVRCVKD
ncbi:MAG: FISUMP domain-containing protein [Bacteroidales bacterium]